MRSKEGFMVRTHTDRPITQSHRFYFVSQLRTHSLLWLRLQTLLPWITRYCGHLDGPTFHPIHHVLESVVRVINRHRIKRHAVIVAMDELLQGATGDA